MAAAHPPRTDDDVLRELVDVRGRRVLDVGCGNGALVRRLAAAGAEALGLEISDALLEPARSGDRDHPERYVVGRAEALPFGDGSLDVVVCSKSLHHVPVEGLGVAFDEARRVLVPGGSLLVVEPLTEGSFFELLIGVEDETEVRAAAQEALARASAHGLARAQTLDYDVEVVFSDFAGARRMIVAVDPARAERFEALEPDLRVLFDRLGEPRPDGRVAFVQPMRADLLHPA